MRLLLRDEGLEPPLGEGDALVDRQAVLLWRWREYGVGPVWLAFEREHGDLVDRCLRDWSERSGRPFCCIDGWSYIELLTRCGRDQVVRGVIAALQEVRDRLASPAST